MISVDNAESGIGRAEASTRFATCRLVVKQHSSRIHRFELDRQYEDSELESSREKEMPRVSVQVIVPTP